MKKQEETNWKENQQQIFPVEDMFSELPPPIPLDALPDPFADPTPVKEEVSPETEESSEEEQKELSPKKKITKIQVLAIVAAVLLVGGLITWMIVSKFGKKDEDKISTADETVFIILDDGQTILIRQDADEIYADYDPYIDDQISSVQVDGDFVQDFSEITSYQLETIEQRSMEQFVMYSWDIPNDIVISSKTPMGVCLISKGQNAPVSSLAMIYEIKIDEYAGNAEDPNAYIGSYTMYWCVEFEGVFSDGSFDAIPIVQEYSHCAFGEEDWDIPGFFELSELFTYLTGQGNDIRIMGIEGEQDIEKVLVDKPQFLSSIQCDSVSENARHTVTVDVLTELSQYENTTLDKVEQGDIFFMTYTNKQGKACNMVLSTYCVNVLDENGDSHTYYRVYGVSDVYVGKDPRKDVFWKDENNTIDLTDEITLIGYESEEALIARLYELFQDAQIWRIDVNMPRHIKEVLTPQTQKS